MLSGSMGATGLSTGFVVELGVGAGLGVCDDFGAKKLEIVCCLPFCEELSSD